MPHLYKTKEIFLDEKGYGRNVAGLKKAVNAWLAHPQEDSFLRFLVKGQDGKESHRILKSRSALQIVLKTRVHKVKKVLLASQLQSDFGNDIVALARAVDIWEAERPQILDALYLVLETRSEEAEMYIGLQFRGVLEFEIVHQHRQV